MTVLRENNLLCYSFRCGNWFLGNSNFKVIYSPLQLHFIGGGGVLRDKIRQLCANKGIKVADLEEKCQIKPGTIKKWDGKSVESPRATTLLSVAQELGVTVEYLLTEEIT